MSKEKFIYCPQCGSGNLIETDYEDEQGEGRACEDCNWEGGVEELVCKDGGVMSKWTAGPWELGGGGVTAKEAFLHAIFRDGSARGTLAVAVTNTSRAWV